MIHMHRQDSVCRLLAYVLFTIVYFLYIWVGDWHLSFCYILGEQASLLHSVHAHFILRT